MLPRHIPGDWERHGVFANGFFMLQVYMKVRAKEGGERATGPG